MAKVTATRTEARITLELDEAEAHYVWAALMLARPAHGQFGAGGADPVWEELGTKMRVAGIVPNGTAAAPIDAARDNTDIDAPVSPLRCLRCGRAIEAGLARLLAVHCGECRTPERPRVPHG